MQKFFCFHTNQMARQENGRFIILLSVQPGMIPLTERQLAERRRQRQEQLNDMFITTANELIQLFERELSGAKFSLRDCDRDVTKDDDCPPAA